MSALYAQEEPRESSLVRFDPEIEVAARRRGEEVRRKKRAEVAMAEDHRVLRDYAMPQASKPLPL